MAEKVKKRLKVHLILTLIAYSFTGWIILIFIDFYGSKSSSVLLKNALLRIDIIGILYIIIGYIIIFLWYWNMSSFIVLNIYTESFPVLTPLSVLQ